MAYTARYWSKNPTGDITCHVCPRNCRLSTGQRGFCFVRQNVDGQMILTTYGRSSGFCVDPIEKKPLHHFYPGSSVFSFGTAGCNLACTFCQNSDISRSKEFDRLCEEATPQGIAQTARKLHCQSVAFTYNEPTIFFEYAVDAAKECHKIGIKTVAVSAGFISPEPRAEFFGHIDAANIDLKSFSDNFYQKYTLGTLKPVLETLEYIKHKTSTWLEITTLLIPGLNDSDKEIDEMSDWIANNLGVDVPLHFSAFHPAFKMTDRPPTPKQTLVRARDTALSKGIRYVYIGNVHDAICTHTYCHACAKRLIERTGYTIGEYNLIETNKCRFCGQICSGHYNIKN